METEKRPWGSYTVISSNENHKMKVIDVNPHSRLSYQSHKHRQETWVVVEGIATVTLDDETYVLEEMQKIHIPKGAKHRLENQNDGRLRIIEIQEGTYFGEDDIERFQDDYGRS